MHQLGHTPVGAHTSLGHAPVGGTHQLGAEFCIPKMSQAMASLVVCAYVKAQPFASCRWWTLHYMEVDLTADGAFVSSRVPPSLPTGFPLTTNRVPLHYQQGSHYQTGFPLTTTGLPLATSRALTTTGLPLTTNRALSHCQQGSQYQQGIQHYLRPLQTWSTCHSCRPQDSKALRFLWMVVLAAYCLKHRLTYL